MSETTEFKVNSKKKSRMPKLNWKVLLVIVLVVASLSTAFYFWNDAQNAKVQTPEAIAAKNLEESKRVIGALDQVLYTESEDQPTVARIEKPSALQESNPEFYKNAQAGDYLILYPQRAVIFRESENRVINVAPRVNLNNITGDQQKTEK